MAGENPNEIHRSVEMALGWDEQGCEKVCHLFDGERERERERERSNTDSKNTHPSHSAERDEDEDALLRSSVGGHRCDEELKGIVLF